MIQFEHPTYLNGLVFLVILALLFIFFLVSRKRFINYFAIPELFKRIAPDNSLGRHIVKFTLLFFAAALLIIGLANPQIGTKYETVKREGIDVMIALDVSKSMLAEDIAPNRMLKAKQLVSNLIDQMNNDRVGLIVFAGNAYLQMPLTVDYTYGKGFLRNIDTDMMPSQGTAITDAINLAMRSFNQEEDKHKALIIISDGENHEGDVLQAINKATESGIRVFTVGVGGEKGAPIPTKISGEFKKDNQGNMVLTKLNEDMLEELANTGNGKYFNISEGALAQNLISEFKGMEGKAMEEKVITDYKDQFIPFLIAALVLLVIELLIVGKKQNIFNWVKI